MFYQVIKTAAYQCLSSLDSQIIQFLDVAQHFSHSNNQSSIKNAVITLGVFDESASLQRFDDYTWH